jgi:hypothetical protein
MHRRLQVIALIALFAAAGCQRSCGGASAQGDAGSAATASAVGVPECDDYLTKFQQCVAKAPADRKQALEQNLERTRTAWKGLAANPGAKPGLPQTCTLALQTARTTLKQLDCSW